MHVFFTTHLGLASNISRLIDLGGESGGILIYSCSLLLTFLTIVVNDFEPFLVSLVF
jgi:hypothetical protein